VISETNEAYVPRTGRENPRLRLTPFAPRDVKLLAGPHLDAFNSNRDYLRRLNLERLLHNFRVNAGIPTSGRPYGGWEARDCGLRGHFVGHYLSACASIVASSGQLFFKKRLRYVVTELGKCQTALGNGYLSAFPESHLDTIETEFKGAWAPYYVLHKILAGMFDVANLCGDGEALEVAIGLARYIMARFERLSADVIETMLRTDAPNPENEFGGCAEAFRMLARLTGDPGFEEFAVVFDRKWFLNPLVEGVDELSGLHCNTHIPLVLGAAKRYESTGELRFRTACLNFWECTALCRSYVNGGSSGPRPDRTEKSEGAEHWHWPFTLASTLTPKINESCVTHNMLRLTDVLFICTADPKYSEFRERANLNSVLCMYLDKTPGRYLYHHPLSSNSRKEHGNPFNSFWCCYGTTIEAFTRFSNSVYYQTGNELWINQYISSELKWIDKAQETRYPVEETVRLTFNLESPELFALRLRIPSWLAQRPLVTLNRTEIDIGEAGAGEFARITRTWEDGDVLEAKFPMSLRTEATPDDPGTFAFLYGPIVLAALSDRPLTLSDLSVQAAWERVRQTSMGNVAFEIELHDGTPVELVPLNSVGEEPYGVYFKLLGGFVISATTSER